MDNNTSMFGNESLLFPSMFGQQCFRDTSEQIENSVFHFDEVSPKGGNPLYPSLNDWIRMDNGEPAARDIGKNLPLHSSCGGEFKLTEESTHDSEISKLKIKATPIRYEVEYLSTPIQYQRTEPYDQIERNSDPRTVTEAPLIGQSSTDAYSSPVEPINQSGSEGQNIQSLNEDHLQGSNITTPKISLGKRRDVVHKTIIRTIKKLIVSSYRQDFKQRRFRSGYRKLQYFHNSLAPFVSNITEPIQSKAMNFSNSEVTTEVFARIVDSATYDKLVRSESIDSTPAIKRFCKEFLDCCSSYSHSKFDSLVGNEYFSMLYAYFRSQMSTEDLKSHKTMSKHSDVYLDALSQIEASIQTSDC